jgi:hypothetical protein
MRNDEAKLPRPVIPAPPTSLSYVAGSIRAVFASVIVYLSVNLCLWWNATAARAHTEVTTGIVHVSVATIAASTRAARNHSSLCAYNW